ncbi:hypothetical protein DPMN_057264 [Dreissena polymorpha]|uniref:Uncharacterized protein n=1 Tax=Dreissena polymorpha TaxID=45954 RepID=A0A9D4CVV9_DREPO|nr:hypothetical protein DPMN_057264 [Dreissena polymorpha]
MINTRLVNVVLQAGKYTHCRSRADAPNHSSSAVQTGSVIIPSIVSYGSKRS